MPRSLFPILLLLIGATASPARADRVDDMRDVWLANIDPVVAQADRDVQRAASDAAQGRPVADVRSNLEQLALYRELRTHRVRFDPDELQALPTAPAGTLQAVGAVRLGSLRSYADVQKAIERDRAFLAQSSNNTFNARFVEQRLVVLETHRDLILKKVKAHAAKEADAGDRYMGTWFVNDELRNMGARARAAEATLGASGKAKAPVYVRFVQKLARHRDLLKRKQLTQTEAETLDAMLSEIKSDGEGAYDVVVVRLSSQSYGIGKPGDDTTMEHFDGIHVLMGLPQAINKRLAKWSVEHQNGWCRGYWNRPVIYRRSFQVLKHVSSLSGHEAGKVRWTALRALFDAGWRPGASGGAAGPMSGITTPFTVPGNVESIRECKSRTS